MGDASFEYGRSANFMIFYPLSHDFSGSAAYYGERFILQMMDVHGRP